MSPGFSPDLYLSLQSVAAYAVRHPRFGCGGPVAPVIAIAYELDLMA